MDEADKSGRGHGQTIHRKNTQKSKFLLSQTFKWKKIMFFVKNFLITLTLINTEGNRWPWTWGVSQPQNFYNSIYNHYAPVTNFQVQQYLSSIHFIYLEK